MHGVGGRVAVGDEQPARLVVAAPVLLVGGVAVHSVEGGSRVGIHIVGMRAERAAEVQLDERGGLFAVAREVELAAVHALALQPLKEEPGLRGLAGAVRPLKDNEPSLVHFRFSPATWTRKSGSFIMRPARDGFLMSR